MKEKKETPIFNVSADENDYEVAKQEVHLKIPRTRSYL